MTAEAAIKVTELAEALKDCANALESQNWQELHDRGEHMARLARWLQLDEQDQ